MTTPTPTFTLLQLVRATKGITCSRWDCTSCTARTLRRTAPTPPTKMRGRDWMTYLRCRCRTQQVHNASRYKLGCSRM
jgi:hypothetical protein